MGRKRDPDLAERLADGENIGLTDLARPHAAIAMETLVKAADPKRSRKVGWATRVSAARSILEMAFHRPAAAPLAGVDHGQINVTILNMTAGDSERIPMYTSPQVDLSAQADGTYSAGETDETQGPSGLQRVGGSALTKCWQNSAWKTVHGMANYARRMNSLRKSPFGAIVAKRWLSPTAVLI